MSTPEEIVYTVQDVCLRRPNACPVCFARAIRTAQAEAFKAGQEEMRENAAQIAELYNKAIADRIRLRPLAAEPAKGRSET